jgi:hypothetical protein
MAQQQANLALFRCPPIQTASVRLLLLQVCDVLSGAIMPALVQHHANLGLANMVWDVLAHMPFPFRAEVRGS